MGSKGVHFNGYDAQQVKVPLTNAAVPSRYSSTGLTVSLLFTVAQPHVIVPRDRTLEATVHKPISSQLHLGHPQLNIFLRPHHRCIHQPSSVNAPLYLHLRPFEAFLSCSFTLRGGVSPPTR